MRLLVSPTVSNTCADATLHFHFGTVHPDRFRNARLNRFVRTCGLTLAWRSRRGAGTQSRVISLALPYLVAEADARVALAARLADQLRSLDWLDDDFAHGQVDLDEARRIEVAERLTSALEAWALEDDCISVDKGRVVDVRRPWALLALGDPREDSYALERVPASALAAADVETEGAPFVRVSFHEPDRDQRLLYLPALDVDAGPSEAVLEMLARVQPARPLDELDGRFVPPAGD